MVKVVLDTSVLIEEIRKGSVFLARLATLAENEKIFLYVPVIVISELWAGESMNSVINKRTVIQKIKPFKRIEIDEKIAKKTGELIRCGQCKGFDALIAACCIENKAKLATLNIKDFEKVKELKIWKS
ncbi:PIN domain-containing protein [Patescibacteria group bacterium]|nr:PIN domain-containing protein [Patescibacteria group bacterium]MCG2701535.1 PIN domain-containing protein [Candidatus Parcubacteria bacterium]MBU4265262.1 PIN domain-containing protein [Patescibacteria group bacterium]MBU4389947.1 PIN domain-containing protein [Patescibacteria group bacterium]MBU4397611.1 PIN domain-containing protein [Patescibacteria group bacterium]